MTTNDSLKRLMSEANVNPQLRRELLRNPEAVAKEWKVELGEEEAARLKKLGAFTDLVAEVKNGRVSSCDPRVCYPVTVWERSVFKDLISELIPTKRPPVFYPIFYPADWSRGDLFDFRRNFRTAPRLRDRFIPDEIFYPADNFGRLFERLRDDLTKRLEIMLEEKLNMRR